MPSIHLRARKHIRGGDDFIWPEQVPCFHQVFPSGEGEPQGAPWNNRLSHAPPVALVV